GVGMNSAYSRLIRISRRSGAADWMRMMRSARGWLSTLKPTRDDLPISASICRSRRLEFGRPQVRQMLENRTGDFAGIAGQTLEGGEGSWRAGRKAGSQRGSLRNVRRIDESQG